MVITIQYACVVKMDENPSDYDPSEVSGMVGSGIRTEPTMRSE